ncbi:MAG: hypothetical protein KC420_04195, partial [Myxococcales bacterium]|nr:hypothetical protein [Myxococcales bacterium]
AFLDERIVGWLLREAPEGLRTRLLARGGAAARRLLALLAGEALVRDLSDFLELFVALRPGFLARAEAVQALLREPTTAFALVTTPLADNLADAAYLRDGLAARGIDVAALVFNRAHVPLGDHPWSWAASERPLADDLAALAPADADETSAFTALLERLNLLRRGVAADNQRGRRAIVAFAAAAVTGCLKVQAPILDREPQELRGLARLAAILADPRATVAAPR